MKNRHLLTAIPLMLFATCGLVQAQFTVTTNADNTLTLTQYTGTNGVVIIPDTLNGYPVTMIGTDAFAYK